MRVSLLLLLLLVPLLSVSGGKRKGSKTKTKNPNELQTLRKALDPKGILSPSKKTDGIRDLAKVAEETIVDQHLRLSSQVLNWLHKVVDVGKGIANGMCRIAGSHQ